MNRLKFFQLLTFLLMFFSVSAISEELKIPILVGQTGSSAVFGKPELDAYRLAVEEWNARGGIKGEKISLQVEDTQTNQRQILTAFQSLARNNPQVILGPTWLDTFQALVPIARQKKILLVTPSASRESFTPQNADWPISFYHNSTLEIKVLLDGLKERGLDRPALIYQHEPFAEMIRKLLIDSGINLTADIGVQEGEADFSSLLVKLKQQNPNVIIVFVWDEKSLHALLRQIKIHLPEINLASVHDGESWIKNPVFSPYLPQLIYTKFVLADESFNLKFFQRFGYQPILTASNAYDAINGVLLAMSSGRKTPSEIKQFLLQTKLKTVTFGDFQFNEDRSVPSQVKVIEHRG